jgi:hypothetical protein
MLSYYKGGTNLALSLMDIVWQKDQDIYISRFNRYDLLCVHAIQYVLLGAAIH